MDPVVAQDRDERLRVPVPGRGVVDGRSPTGSRPVVLIMLVLARFRQ